MNKKPRIPILIILTSLLLGLAGCSNMIEDLSQIDLNDGQQIILATSDGNTIKATLILDDSDSGLDFDGDGNVDLPLVSSETESEDGLYAFDSNGDGAADIFIQVSDKGTSKMNTASDGDGAKCTIVLSDDDTLLGIDTNGDGNADVIIDASSNDTADKYGVIYDANGGTGTVPSDSSQYSSGDTVTVLGNNGGLVNGSNVFLYWNTAADGSGSSNYSEGDTFSISADTTLFAQYGSLPVTIDGITYSELTATTMEVSDADTSLSGAVSPLSSLGPYVLVEIGNAAFRDCVSITEITVPSGVETLDSEAFRACTSLSDISLPVSLTSIGINAFYQAGSLSSVTLPAALSSMGQWALYESGLTSITIPGGLGTIPAYAFQNAANLATVVIEEGVTQINDSAFENCDSLTSLTLPGSMDTIGNRAFAYHELTSITIPDGVQTIGDYAFSYQEVNPVTIVINSTVITDIERAFDRLDISSFSIHTAAAPTVALGDFENDGTDIDLHYPSGGTGYGAAPWANFTNSYADL